MLVIDHPNDNGHRQNIHKKPYKKFKAGDTEQIESLVIE
jgi:hypothetical protein